MRKRSSRLTGLVLALLTTGAAFAQIQKAPDPVAAESGKAEGAKSRGLLQDVGRKISGESHKLEKNAATESHRLQKSAAEWGEHKAAATVAKIKASPLYKKFEERAASLFMQEPHITKVNPDFKGGSPVYYVNGMLTAMPRALAEATFLSEFLNRPVYLIHNPSFLKPDGNTGTPTCVDDVSESVYDKLWPEHFLGVNVEELIPRIMLPSPPFTQLNPTTKQITWVFYHARGPISMVSHSQGCLQVRNALFTAALLSKEGTIRPDVAWVATGTPVNDKEIYPIPAKYHYEINANDPVPAIIATRGGPGDAESIRKSEQASRVHEPIANYFPRIKASMLFP